MTRLTELAAYRDELGNEIVYSGDPIPNVRILFRGANNRLVVAAPIRFRSFEVRFDCDNGTLSIGSNAGTAPFSAAIRVGQDATVTIGRRASATGRVSISAVEGASVTIGDDVMFATDNQVRADDAHPIFDVRTGRRVNPARSVEIGSHVWLAWGAAVLAGGRVGDGSVIGANSLVTRSIPNNVVAVGSPARVVRRDIAWERPHLSLAKPFYKPDASTVTKSAYWNLTEDGARTPEGITRMLKRVRRRLVRLRAKVSGG